MCNLCYEIHHQGNSDCNKIALRGRGYFGAFYLFKATKYNILAVLLHKMRII